MFNQIIFLCINTIMNEDHDRFIIIGDDSDDTFEYDTEEKEDKEEKEKEITEILEVKIIKKEKSNKIEIQNAMAELDSILGDYIYKKIDKDPDQDLEHKNIKCIKCNKSFNAKYQLDEHEAIHKNEIENTVCICNKCNGVFDSDLDYLNHKYNCSGQNNNNNIPIPIDDNGKYPCPVCNNRFTNSFYLGEHFIAQHTGYDELKVLDEKKVDGPIGFPGFELLKFIEMVSSVHEILEGECKICYFNFDYNIFIDDMEDDNRNSLMLNCCNRPICYSCLKNHISINNNVVCPFCMKDHTKNNIEYITYII